MFFFFLLHYGHFLAFEVHGYSIASCGEYVELRMLKGAETEPSTCLSVEFNQSNGFWLMKNSSVCFSFFMSNFTILVRISIVGLIKLIVS